MLQEIEEWKSIRKFLPDPIPEDKLVSIVQAARRAPSWKNIQPWKFIVTTQEADKEKLSRGFSMGALIKKAPAAILCIGTLQSWNHSHQLKRLRELFAHSGVAMENEAIDKKFLRSEIAQALAANSSSLMVRTFENVGIAYGFMILEAANQGLGACIIGEIDNELSGVNSQEYNEIKSYFGLTETEIITAAIIVGFPATAAK